MDYNTLELARIYEAQGYHMDALQVYETLDRKALGKDIEARAGVARMGEILVPRENPPKDDLDPTLSGSSKKKFENLDPEDRLALRLEQWVGLMVTRSRMRVLGALEARD